MIERSKWFNIDWFNTPLTIYNYVKHIFQKPELHFTYYNMPYRYYEGKVFDLRVSDIVYKMKYNEPRHEENPYIQLTLFGKWQFFWDWRKYFNDKDESMIYWETLLWYWTQPGGIVEAIENNNWIDSNGKKIPSDKICLKYQSYIEYYNATKPVGQREEELE